MLPSPEQEAHLFKPQKTLSVLCSEDHLPTLIQRALDMKRPRLGRDFALLPPSIDPTPALMKAQQALRLMLLNVPDQPDENYWEEVSTQWNSMRSSGALRRLRSRHKTKQLFWFSVLEKKIICYYLRLSKSLLAVH